MVFFFFVHKNAREFELEGINLIVDFPCGGFDCLCYFYCCYMAVLSRFCVLMLQCKFHNLFYLSSSSATRP